MIRYLMSDFDGVLRHWHNENLFRYETDSGLSSGFLFNFAFKDVQLLPAILGTISHESWLENVGNEVKQAHSDDVANALIRHWQESPFTIDLDLVDVYLSTFPGVPIVLASNATSSLNSDLEKAGLSESLKKVINSSDIGLVKPDLAFFKKALEILDCRAEEIIFIDDQKVNVDAANAIGMHGVHFTTREDCYKALSTLRQRII